MKVLLNALHSELHKSSKYENLKCYWVSMRTVKISSFPEKPHTKGQESYKNKTKSFLYCAFQLTFIS